MRIGIVSDIHSNLAALEAVLADADPVDALWCPGDVVGYGPNPNECVELLRGRQAICVAGNHDWAAIGRLPTADFNTDAATAAHWTERQLTPDNRGYLEDLPLTERRGDFTIVHGTLRHPIWQYLLTSVEADETFDLMGSSHCLVGHTHLPAVFLHQALGKPSRHFTPEVGTPVQLGPGELILNPGSVGQPRDGRPESSYALYDSDEQTIVYRRVGYDIERTQRLMRSYDLPARLWQRLSYGW